MFNPRDCKNNFCLSFVLLLALSVFFSQAVFSQANDYFLKSADHEFAMEVSRAEKGIDIALVFSKASQFDCVMIERSADSQNNFSQCKYIKFNESADDSVVIVKRDLYPPTAIDEVYYRVKIITKDGVSRVYPAVRLPAVGEEKKLKQ